MTRPSVRTTGPLGPHVEGFHAAFLCANLGITPQPREDHASHLAHWLEILREDRRAIFAAAAHAQRAVDFLHGVSLREDARSSIESAADTVEGAP